MKCSLLEIREEGSGLSLLRPKKELFKECVIYSLKETLYHATSPPWIGIAHEIIHFSQVRKYFPLINNKQRADLLQQYCFQSNTQDPKQTTAAATYMVPDLAAVINLDESISICAENIYHHFLICLFNSRSDDGVSNGKPNRDVSCGGDGPNWFPTQSFRRPLRVLYLR